MAAMMTLVSVLWVMVLCLDRAGPTQWYVDQVVPALHTQLWVQACRALNSGHCSSLRLPQGAVGAAAALQQKHRSCLYHAACTATHCCALAGGLWGRVLTSTAFI